mmetsp:Transcript_6525/g.27142  ORF Transcript_6525/g.27142 Transcript_6525/m.27142 type:complete len:215 (+) Transcript_6525:68-712(+)
MVMTVLTYATAACASPNATFPSPYAPTHSPVLTCTSDPPGASARRRHSPIARAYSANNASATFTSRTGAYSTSHTSPAYVPCAFSTRPIRTAKSPHHHPTPSTLLLCATVCVLHRARYSFTLVVPSITSRFLRRTTTCLSLAAVGADDVSFDVSGWSTSVHVKTSSATPAAVRETNIPSSALTFLRRALTSALHLWTRESVGLSSARTASLSAR